MTSTAHDTGVSAEAEEVLSLLMQPDAQPDPYALYDRLRQVSPAYYSPSRDTWFLTGYAANEEMLMSADFGQGPNGRSLIQSLPNFAASPALQYLSAMTFLMDPPEHTRIRRLVTGPFNPRRLRELEPAVERLAGEFLDQAKAKPTPDLVADYAEYLPISVISEYLGVPQEDRLQNLEWVHDFHLAVGPVVTEEGMALADAAAARLGEYLGGVVASHRAHPQEGLISEIIAVEEAGDRLSSDELVALCFQLFIAGTETTIGAIGLSINALLDNPDQLAAARDAGGVSPSGVEELLRFEPPAQIDVARVALKDTMIGGTPISAGATVLPVIAAANRDPEQYVDPAVLNLARDDAKHLTLGRGIHTCLGQALARLEVRVAVNTVLRDYPNLARADVPTLRGTSMFRAVEHLPVRLQMDAATAIS